MIPLYPGLAIVPVVRVDRKALDFKGLVGTAFFYDHEPRIMSVRHVLGVQPEPHELLAILRVPLEGGPGRVWPIQNVRSSRHHDLAVAEVPDAEGYQTLSIAAQNPEGLPTLLTYDYSTGLRGGWRPDGTVGPYMIPYVWRGTWLATYMAHDPTMPHNPRR